MAKIEIFRYGNYVNVVNNESELKDWIMNNVQPDNKSGFIRGENISERLLVQNAQKKGYVFRVGGDELISDFLLTRLRRIFEKVGIGDVAADIGTIENHGYNKIGRCPHCGGETTCAIYPRFGAYRCFGCGASGNVLTYAMAAMKTNYAETLEFLEERYLNN